MVLSFALCATLAFAQTQNFAGKKVGKVLTNNAKAEKVVKPAAEPTDYKASIFSKDDDVIQAWDFSSTSQFTLGQVGTNTMIGGDIAVPHVQNSTASKWARVAGIDAASLTAANFSAAYPQWYSWFDGRNGDAYFQENLAAWMDTALCSSDNGWMIIDFMEESRANQTIDAYIEFAEALDLTNYPVVDFRFFQWYMKFNRDNCWIDYTTNNGITWSTMEINVKNIDVATNGRLYGYYSYTLPLSVGGQSNVKLRLRASSSAVSSGVYGYVWMIDDVEVVAGPYNRVRTYEQFWGEGAYQMVPQGMNLPIYWRSQLTNNGLYTQENVIARINHLASIDGNSTVVDEYNNGYILAENTKYVLVDGLGRFPSDTNGEYREWRDGLWEYSSHQAMGQGNSLPTSTVGDNYTFASIHTDSINIISYDTVWYNVDGGDANGNYIWGHDKGLLTTNKFFAWGFTDAEDGEYYVTDDCEEHAMEPNYSVWAGYNTGMTVPTDENGQPWVIRGIRYVTSTTFGKFFGESMIEPTLYFTDPDSGYYHNLNTGIEYIEVSDAASAGMANDSTDIMAAGGFMTMDDYNYIDVMFPEQNALEANLMYFVGYRLVEPGYFSLASATGSTYYRPDVDDDGNNVARNTRFGSENAAPGTAKYAHDFNNANGPANGWSLLVRDPLGKYPSQMYPAGKYAEAYPMMYPILGPRQDIARHNIAITCENEFAEVILNDGATSGCGETDDVAEGSTTYYFIVPDVENGYDAKIYVDGQEVVFGENPNLEWNANGYYILYMRNVTTDHTLRVVGTVGINTVADKVQMNLQPNPATSQVNLTIEGVNGMVNCAIVDMSGRVVYNNSINAEAAQTINVSNLAKGAYFVRITNNEFSKVEKLIVR